MKKDRPALVAHFDGSIPQDGPESYRTNRILRATFSMWRRPAATASGPMFKGYRAGTWGTR